MKLGYARVSKGEAGLDLQVEALREAGALRIWEDNGVSGSAVLKPALIELLDYARPDDEIVVWRLDRLSRSLITLMAELEQIGQRGVAFRSLTEGISAQGGEDSPFFHAVAAFRAFDKDVLHARTHASDAGPERKRTARERAEHGGATGASGSGRARNRRSSRARNAPPI